MSDYNLLIDGKMVPGDQTMPVLNPATEEVLAQCPRASKDQLDKAVAAAKAAYPAWAATPIEQRRALVIKMAEAIEANTNELARLLTSEQGKPLADATGEVMGMAGFFRYLGSLELPMRVIENSGDRKVEAYRRPLGVVGAIIPWNYPLLILAFKLPSALLAGNALVVKPAPTTPLASLRFAELVKDILPKGVLNFIADANDLGDHMTKHPDIRKISFTGSSATGQKVMASASQTLKRITLELGGNDAGIVLDDVDPKKVAPGIFEGAFQNSGQVCLAIKRLYARHQARAAAEQDAVREGEGVPRRRPQERQRDRRRRCDGSPRLFHRADHRARHQGRLQAGRRGAVRSGAACHQVLRQG
jgi:acyl-CoA reductase-like NAD-dependent aldehyde dehydrogenase